MEVTYTDPSEGTDKSVKVKKLTISNTRLSLDPGQTETLKVTPDFQDTGASAAVSFGTSNRDVATVDKDGTVYARDMGNAVITACCGNQKLEIKVTVD